jgi:ABC-type bacteriocin/lantibiotic exporter with double-glycine peptidase domain
VEDAIRQKVSQQQTASKKVEASSRPYQLGVSRGARYLPPRQDALSGGQVMPPPWPPRSSYWQTLQRVMRPRQRRRVPVVQQMSAVECGAACDTMILGYYGHHTSMEEIRDRTGVGRDGLSALDLVQAARSYGLRVRAIALQEPDLRDVALPAIVHWAFNHFLVVEDWSERSVGVVDPASGRRRMTTQQFDAGFTGVVIMLEPGEQFVPRLPTASRTLSSYVITYVKRMPIMLLQIIGASLLLQVFGLAVPVLTEVVVDQIIPLNMTNILGWLGIGLLILLLAQFVTLQLRASLLVYLQARLDTHLMPDFVEHLLLLPARFFEQRSNGDLLARVSSNTAIRDLVGTHLAAAILDSGLVVTYLALLLAQSLPFGLLVLAIGAAQVIVLLLSSGALQACAGRELEAQGKMQGYLSELLTGMATVKAAGAEQQAFEQWSNLFSDQVNQSVRQNYLSASINTVMSSLNAVSSLGLLWMGAIQVLAGTMQVGTMLALVALSSVILVPLESLVTSGQELQMIRAHLQRLVEVLEAAPEQQAQQVHAPPRLTGRIWLDQVSFQYDPQGQKVLQDITVQIEAGQKVALVGRTGSGKSTLGKLLLGLCQPTEGEICYDDIPLPVMNYQQVRTQCGVVLQDVHVFNGSIRQNITFYNPELNLAQVIEAAKIAGLHDEIMQMPMGYETVVSEQGSSLSGGQRQRLALARALVHAPVILLLDEATSSLDVITERVVERNLDALGCTQIVIAHRLSTIRNADRILVLDQGRIVESGSHEELVKQNRYYAQLIRNQLSAEEQKTC